MLVGTDPENIRGGIGTAMQGHVRALECQGALCRVIPSYSPVERHGRWLVALKAIPIIFRTLMRIRREGSLPCHFAHAGSWPSMIREGILVLVSRILGARILYQLHSPDVDAYLQSARGKLLFKAGILPVHALGVLTPWWKMRLLEAGIRKPIFVIPNPLPPDLEKTALTPEEGPPLVKQRARDVITVLAMARLVEGKGVDAVINALPLLPEKIHLQVAGDGPQKMVLEQLAVEQGVADRVTFVGWVGEERYGNFSPRRISFVCRVGMILSACATWRRWPSECRSLLSIGGRLPMSYPTEKLESWWTILRPNKWPMPSVACWMMACGILSGSSGSIG